MKRKFAAWLASASAALLMLVAGPAFAQATRTWVSGVGDDVNPCSRTAPCKTFAGAISKTAAQGVINCLDPGGFGAVTITKSITIDCRGIGGGILASLTNGVVVNAATTDNVTLRGLSIEGVGTGINGVSFVGGGTLHIEDCRIFGFRGGTGYGVRFAPPATGSQLLITDTALNDNTVGVHVRPTGIGMTRATLRRVGLSNNGDGLVSEAAVNGTFVRVQLSEVSASSNDGSGVISRASGGGYSNVFVFRSQAVHNGTFGLLADGAAASLAIGSSLISDNTTGLGTLNGGGRYSYGDNGNFANHGSDGQPPEVILPKQ
ncbi:hypothetical protein [Usitatibacter palustris]|uniref:Right handed beta helix region n=1 Tax=Usitatibacter palustris TaxID=2732487 RepID=A0A6M4H8W6_9PROT|nr:hypothetical protein [Usitatibacter palustris]QJR14824.1 hypothetical protein DSM104440_01637 [Usitatibacter palustris]